jgi:class 3 adenylate cyclase
VDELADAERPLGDTVNVASRLEHLTRELGAEIGVGADLVDVLRATLPATEAARLIEGFMLAPPQALRGRNTAPEVFIRFRESG